MKVKFFTQEWLNRTEWIIVPTIGVIVHEKGWSIAFVWLKWSVSFCFGRENHG